MFINGIQASLPQFSGGSHAELHGSFKDITETHLKMDVSVFLPEAKTPPKNNPEISPCKANY